MRWRELLGHVAAGGYRRSVHLLHGARTAGSGTRSSTPQTLPQDGKERIAIDTRKAIKAAKLQRDQEEKARQIKLRKQRELVI